MLAKPSNGLFPPTAAPIPEEAAATHRLRQYVPQLSLAERDRRWDLLRKKMHAGDLDALIFLGNDIYWGMGMANMRYAFQVDSQIGGDALFVHDGDPVVWNAPPHMQRPTNMYRALQDWVTDLRSRGGMRAIAEEVAERGLERGRIGLVGFSSPLQPATLLHTDVVALERLLPQATFSDASGLLQDLRMVKSVEEIDMLRAAGRIARRTIDALVETARPGVVEAAVYAEMIRTQIANGGDPNIFNLFTAGPVDHPPHELWHLLHGCEQPLTPTQRPLADGDIIVTEFHTKYGGYRCHTEFTVYVGKKAPSQLLRIWEVTLECFEQSKKALVAGNTVGEAIRMIREPAKRAGLDWVELGFHAMGTASPEFPTVIYEEGYGTDTMNGANIADVVLEEGMTFGNNLDLHDSRWKVDVGCQLSDFMVVRPGEAELLVGTPTELPQVG